ncbi:MAG: DUF1080 domain-containing protein [Cyclobacteriaceae bacterium]|nr:DUF1080 domain-containing protein [Cyclobacteriaceae bacterium]
MKTISIFLLGFLLFTSCQPREASEPEPTSPQWISLFNGNNLVGWTIRIRGKELGENYGNTFQVDSGILKIRYHEYQSYDDQFGAIYFNRPFSNYRLKIEYRFVGETAPGAPEWGYRDSGVQFHGQSPQSMKPGQSFPVCLEYNLHGGNGTDERPTGEVCTIGTYVQINGSRNPSFCTPPEVKRTFHGDQWVTLEIEVRDSVITHYVNGEEIITYSSPRYDPDHEFAGDLIEDGNDHLTSGYISLQSNSHPIDFRKIEILEY